MRHIDVVIDKLEVIVDELVSSKKLRVAQTALVSARKAKNETLGLQKMETAPRDGREVLLKVAYRAGIPGKYLVGHYMPGGHCIEDHPPISAGWYFWNGCEFDRAAEPIAWMELPESDCLWESQ